VTEEQQRQEVEPLGNWIPAEVDTESPNAARMYDYFLGGAHNFAADRELAERVKKLIPAELFAQMNRAFLGRVVKYLAEEAGVRQFLDLGSGVPTVGNVHEVAQDVSPDCRVVYVDNEPVAVAHSQLMLERNDGATMVAADLRYPHTVLTHPGVLQLIDFGEPVAVLMCAVLHFVPDDDEPARIVAAYRDFLAPGSYLALSHATADDYPDELAKAVELYENTSTPATLRTHAQINQLFDGFTLVPPGLVFTPLWRPYTSENGVDPRQSLCYGGVAVL
jgi:hypothetical protein